MKNQMLLCRKIGIYMLQFKMSSKQCLTLLNAYALPNAYVLQSCGGDCFFLTRSSKNGAINCWKLILKHFNFCSVKMQIRPLVTTSLVLLPTVLPKDAIQQPSEYSRQNVFQNQSLTATFAVQRKGSSRLKNTQFTILWKSYITVWLEIMYDLSAENLKRLRALGKNKLKLLTPVWVTQ